MANHPVIQKVNVVIQAVNLTAQWGKLVVIKSSRGSTELFNGSFRPHFEGRVDYQGVLGAKGLCRVYHAGHPGSYHPTMRVL